MSHNPRFSLADVCEWLSIGLPTTFEDIVFNGVSVDSRNDCSGKLFVGIEGNKTNGGLFYGEGFRRGARAAIVDLSVVKGMGDGFHTVDGKPLIVVEDSLTALKRCARGYLSRLKSVCVIAITGSCGKTTTKEMLYLILKNHKRVVKSPESYNNTLGVSLTILSAPLDTEILILEFGTSAPGEIGALCDIAQPDISVLTAVGAAHLEGLGSIEGVFREKTTIIRRTKNGGSAVINADAVDTEAVIAPCSVRKVLVSTKSQKADLVAESLRREEGYVRFRIGELEGRLNTDAFHLVSDALCAIAAAELVGVSRKQAIEALEEFSPSNMRMEQREIDGIRLINDCYNANFLSVCAAVAHLGSLSQYKRRIFIFGDMLELGAESESLHRKIGERIALSGIDVLVCIGSFSKVSAEAASRLGLKQVFQFGSVEDASEFLNSFVQPQDVILTKASRKMRLESLINRFSCRKNRREDGVA
jgi:UDP-N-acetylmuramoyl-tripeptide--D-alanyl-D-alanine ligase